MADPAQSGLAARLRAWGSSDRWRGRLAWALLAGLLVRAALPLILEWSIEWQGTEQLGRVVEVGDVDLAVLPGGIALEKLVVGPIFEGDEPASLDPEDAHFRADRIEARWSWLSLLGGELHLEGLDLVAPELLAVRAADGRLVPVLRPQSTPGPPEPDPVEPDPSEQEQADGAGWPLRLDRLRVADLDVLYLDLATASRRPLEFQMEQFALDDLTLVGNEISLGTVGLQGPRLRVRRDIDLEPFVGDQPDATAQATPTPTKATAPPAYRIAEIALERAELQLAFDEREIDSRLSFHVRDLSGEVGERAPMDVRLELEEGWLELAGEIGLVPPAFAGTLTWSDLPLEPVSTGADLTLQVSSGTTSGSLDIDLLVADVPERGPSRIDVSGQLAVAGFAAGERSGSLDLAWSLFEVELSRLSLRPDGEDGRPVAPLIEVAALRLRDPAVRVTRLAVEAPTGEASDAPPVGEEPAPESAADGAPPRVGLGVLELTGGRAEFVDETVTPRHRSEIRDLALHGRDLRWPEREARELTLSSRGPRDATLACDVSLRAGKGRVRLDLEDLGLADFSPYVADAGYWIEGGEASLRAQVGIAGERVDVDSDLELLRLDVAEVTPGSFDKQFGVPLDLALALLRDPSGRISLPIAAKTENGEADIAVASLVTAALRQAVVGALTAPLKSFGLLLGSGGEDGQDGLRLEPVVAQPGAVEPQLERLPQLAEMLAARPGLGLELRGSVGAEDEPALAERALTERIIADAELPPVEAGFLQKRRLRGALEQRARGEARELDADDTAALARWIEAVDVSDEERHALADARATALRDALADRGVAPERIEIGAPLEGPPGVVVELAPVGR